jgi:putative ABC transport system permease protein
VSLGQYHPLGLLDTRMLRVSIEGYEPRQDEDLAFMANTVGPDYFRTLRINMVAGRTFEDRDHETAQPVIVVNNTLAERFWGSAANAIGRHMSVANGESRTVIGVAADLKYSRVNETPRPYFYQPIHQVYRTAMILYVRGAGSVDALANLARAHVASIDPDLPVLYSRPFTTGGAFIFYDFTAMMLFIFGFAGMALAAIGTYGLVSYTVKQSTREIGIRMALGANHFTVVRGFLARGLRLGLIGAALGIVAALSASGLLSSVLFGVSTTDVMAFMQALAIVLGVVALATILPAWRATRTKPLNALRHQ